MVTICTASLTFRNSSFCPHSVFMCFVWIWEQTAIISLYNINWLVFRTEIPGRVFHFLEYGVTVTGYLVSEVSRLLFFLSRRVKSSIMSIAFLYFQPLKKRQLRCLQTSRTRSPLRQVHIPKEWIPHPRRSETDSTNWTSAFARCQLLLRSSLGDTYACVGTAA